MVELDGGPHRRRQDYDLWRERYWAGCELGLLPVAHHVFRDERSAVIHLMGKALRHLP